jgi:hypothetical protein
LKVAKQPKLAIAIVEDFIDEIKFDIVTIDYTVQS